MKISEHKKGVWAAIIAAATFGMMPLLSKLVMDNGFSVNTIVTYRYATAAIILFFMMLYKKASFKISGKQFLELCVLSVCYPSVTSLLMISYDYLSTGISTSIHFLYPIPVAFMMAFFFKEKVTIKIIIGILISACGVLLLGFNEDYELNPVGILIVLAAVLIYSIYLVMISQLSVRKLTGLSFSFYVLSIASIYSFIFGTIQGDLQFMNDSISLILVFMLSLVSTVISNIALVESVKRIGSTLTSVFGTTEPLIAVLLGLLINDEPFSIQIGLGMTLIFSAVLIIILRKEKRKNS
ncbi:MAG TPA: DMT family transporter [Paludibacteraceae bacterium]|nr:DMT family transporter [Paludibacteraceae bacterium]